MRVLCQVSVQKKVHCEHHILQGTSGAFRDYLRSLLTWTTGDSMRQSLSSFSARSVNPVGVGSGASNVNGNIKIAYEYIDGVCLLSLL